MPLNPRLRRWPGQVAWLLGASSGIGRATAHRLHGLGARVVVSARSEAALQAFVAEHAGSFTLWLKTLRHLSDGLYFSAVRRATGL